MGDLGDYLETIRGRHVGLSKRKMALEAGLNETAVQQIIAGRTGASPSTLKALADRWGTDDDYRELMRLAGHPLPEIDLTSAQKNLVERYNELSPGTQRAIAWLLHVSGAQEPTLSEMEEAAQTLSGSERWEFFEIALGRVRE